MIAPFGTTPKKTSPPPVYAGYPIGMIRWDAWTNDPAIDWWLFSGMSKFYGVTDTKFICRQALQWETSQLWNVSSGPNTVDTQKIVDAELAYCKNKVDFWFYVWAPPASIVSGNDASNLLNTYLAHKASPLKTNVKYAFILLGQDFSYPSFSWANETAFANWMKTEMADPNYMKITTPGGTFPLVGVYNDTNPTTHALNWTATHWNSFKAITGTVFGAAFASTTLRTSLALNAIVTYGPNGTQVSGSGNKSALALKTKCASTWSAVPGAFPVANFTMFQDGRPIPGPRGLLAYCDKFSQPDLVTFLQTQVLTVPNAKFALGYNHSEATEGGPGAYLSYQEGSRHYDALFWARGAPRPSRYTYELSVHSAAAVGTANAVIVTGSGWAYQFPDPAGIAGAHDNDEMWTSTLGDSIKLNQHDRLQSVTLIGSRAPGLGTGTIKANGVAVGTADFNGIAAVRQPIFTWDFNDNPPVSGTFELVCDGTGEIRPDALRITYKP